jgi:hypothetical protein
MRLELQSAALRGGHVFLATPVFIDFAADMVEKMSRTSWQPADFRSTTAPKIITRVEHCDQDGRSAFCRRATVSRVGTSVLSVAHAPETATQYS